MIRIQSEAYDLFSPGRSPGPSGNLILILFGRFENAAFHIPFSSENPFLKISSSHFLASF